MKTLNVLMNGLLVGYLTQQNNGLNSFIYDDSWLNTAGARPISLSMPLRKKSYDGSVVYNFFDNLLPDSLEIRRRITARFGAKSTEPFELLSKIGRDIVGAIQLISEDSQQLDVKKIAFTQINNYELEKILMGYQSQLPLGMLTELDDFRISIAGAQEKTALLKIDESWCIPTGVTPTTHIFKLPIGKIQTHSYSIDLTQSVENEYMCLLIARAYGLPVPNAEIIQLNKIRALCVERFDRRYSSDKTWIMRIPQEDFCQVLNVSPALKYESQGGPGIKDIMNYLRGSVYAKRDRYLFMKAQVLFWLLAATDGHAKNFSVFLLPDGQFELTPLYDIISLYPVINKQGMHIKEAKLAMSLRGHKGKKYAIDQIFPRHFYQTAIEVDFPDYEMTEIIDYFISRTPSVVELIKTQLPSDFPKHLAEAILTGLESRSKRLKVI